MNKKIHPHFTELQVLEKATALKTRVIELLTTFCTHEKFPLSNQFIHPDKSVSLSKIKWYGHNTFKDKLHFFIQCRISVSELYSHLIDVVDHDYISKQDALDSFESNLDKIDGLLNSYISYLYKNIR